MTTKVSTSVQVTKFSEEFERDTILLSPCENLVHNKNVYIYNTILSGSNLNQFNQ